MAEIDKQKVLAVLNSILEHELAGVVRYTHFSFMVVGYGRIPIVSWLRAQADESLLHAQEAGEIITLLGGQPSLSIGALLDQHHNDIGAILRTSLQGETQAVALYRKLLEQVKDSSVVLEEYARKMIYAEEVHVGEVEKMLRKPDDAA
ncbi:MAG: bacterioferritin [Candidatus Accumulibacter sp.]|jgi:bacterioferritin|uniref:Bacterioferritin n=1 Tax=Candidatus Accumulibacter affinis TaxID=2954384 RepID=A0A935T8I1_9PROT|nr:bacterioferritin [Candidatus Accumulibacter affinis]MBP9805652.1 bacterioferritin [Accumulibacter sp.]